MRAPHSFCLLGAVTLAGLAVPGSAQPVGEEFQVNTETAFSQQTSRDRAVAADASGNFVVVWVSGGSQDGSSNGVFGQRYDNQGSPRGGEFQINSSTTDDQTGPSVASDADGNFVVVWQGYGAGAPYQAIFGQRFDSAGHALGSEFRVNTTFPGGGSPLELPSVASAAAGNFVVVWDCDTHQPYGQCATFGQRFNAQGVPLGGEFQIGSTSSGDPVVASDSSGNFVVAYAEAGIRVRRYDASGVPRGNAFRVDSLGGSDPSISSDTAGNFVVTWHAYSDQDGDGFGVFGRRVDSAGVPQGAEFQVNSYTTDWQQYSSVASEASGSFVVAWSSTTQDGSGRGVFGQRYDSEGVALGAEFQINSWTSGSQLIPSVATTGPGQFVVVWYSYPQDGSGRGVFGQRFDFGGAGSITVVSPNTDVRWRIGSLHRIQWTHDLGIAASFRIKLDRGDDGTYEELIAAAAPASSPTRGTFAWTVTGPLSGKARVRVSWTDDLAVSDASDVTFQIRPVAVDH